jgi:hypothetical protein
MEKDSSGWLDMQNYNDISDEIKFKRLLEFLKKVEDNFVFFLDNIDRLIQ